MAVMNITPDSFSDGGSLYRDRVDLDLVLAHAERCLSEGATILDVGG
jgi:dihydropteroate synthase